MNALKNSVQLLGRLGADAQVKISQNGVPYCFVRLVTNAGFSQKDKSESNIATWHTLNIWGNQVKLLEKRGKKGSMWLVQGSLQNSKFTDRDGKEQFRTEIKVEHLMFLSNYEQEADESE